MKASAKK